MKINTVIKSNHHGRNCDTLYNERKEKLFLPSSQPAMPIIDIFKGQITEKVLKVLQDNKIVLITVLANLTYLFQELDV